MTIAEIIILTPDRWREAKQLRLEALLEEPTAFASSYGEELAFRDNVWIARLATAYERGGNLTFFAAVDGALVGMAGATWPAREKTRHVATLYGVYVSPEQRGKGIAAQLMRRLLAELSALPQLEKVGLTVNSACEPAVRLYQRLGFERVGRARRELRVGEQYCDLLYMERFLPET